MHEAENILRSFPDIELSYEKKIHNKVPFHNVVLTVPKGRKYLVWFRVYKRGNVCLLLELDRYKKGIKNQRLIFYRFVSIFGSIWEAFGAHVGDFWVPKGRLERKS